MANIAQHDAAYDAGSGRVVIRRGDTVTATAAQVLEDVVVVDDGTFARTVIRRFIA